MVTPRPKRQKREGPHKLPLVAVTWVDAQRSMRVQYNEDLIELTTVGALVGETDRAYFIANEVEAHVNYMGSEMDLTKVPKALVLRIQTAGEVEMFISEGHDEPKETEARDTTGVAGVSPMATQ